MTLRTASTTQRMFSLPNGRYGGRTSLQTACSKRSQSKRIQLLEGLSSGIGIANDLLLGIFDPVYGFNDLCIDSNSIGVNRSQTKTQRWSMTKKERGLCSEFSKQDGHQFMHELCGRPIYESLVEDHTKKTDEAKGGKLIKTFENVKDLANGVQKMESYHCKKYDYKNIVLLF